MSDACCCLSLGGKEMVDRRVAVAQVAEEHVSSHESIRMVAADRD